uniref:Uncharacterized protein n=1 Tax=Anopheles arabiensis TaxID=7173 RepID=A0A182IF82_ANOAR
MFPVLEAGGGDTPVRGVKTMVNDFTNTTALHIHTCASVCVCEYKSSRFPHRSGSQSGRRKRCSKRPTIRLFSTKSQQLFFLQADGMESHPG